MPAAYEIRAGGDVKNKKQSMADLKLRRLNELNSRLREDLERPRIKVSEASMSCVMALLLRRCAVLILIPHNQVNPILHKHKRLYGAFYVGLGKSLSTSNATVNGALHLGWSVVETAG